MSLPVVTYIRCADENYELNLASVGAVELLRVYAIEKYHAITDFPDVDDPGVSRNHHVQSNQRRRRDAGSRRLQAEHRG